MNNRQASNNSKGRDALGWLASELLRGVVLVLVSAFLAYHLNTWLGRERLSIAHLRVAPRLGTLVVPRDQLDALLRTQSWKDYGAREPDYVRNLEATATYVSRPDFNELRDRVDDFLLRAERRARADTAAVNLANSVVAVPSKEFDALVRTLREFHPDLAARLRLHGFDALEDIKKMFRSEIENLE